MSDDSVSIQYYSGLGDHLFKEGRKESHSWAMQLQRLRKHLLAQYVWQSTHNLLGETNETLFNTLHGSGHITVRNCGDPESSEPQQGPRGGERLKQLQNSK